jgi:hypothetical protein
LLTLTLDLDPESDPDPYPHSSKIAGSVSGSAYNECGSETLIIRVPVIVFFLVKNRYLVPVFQIASNIPGHYALPGPVWKIYIRLNNSVYYSFGSKVGILIFSVI